MATRIQIKRSSGATAPTTAQLLEGELAYSQDRTGNGAGAILYIESVASDGSTAVIDKVGGKYYTGTVDSFLTPATSSVADKVVFHEATANGSNNITLKAPDTLNANVTYTLPATYVNDQYLKVDGSGNLSFAAIPSGSFTIAGDTGTDTFTTGNTLTFTGSDAIDTTVTDETVTISAKDATDTQKGVASFDSTNFTVTTGAVAINSVQASKVDITGATALDPLAGDDSFLVYDLSATANKKITAENVADYIYAGVSGAITISESGVASMAANSVALGADTTGNYVATVAGTANQISVTGSGSETAAVTIALTNDVALVGDLTVGGNDIKMAGGTTALTFSGSGDVEVAGDLQVTGNDIKMAAGTTALSFSGTGDVKTNGDLIVGGQDIKSGNGTTALTLSDTSGNVTVAGDLQVSGNDIKSSTGTTAITLDGANVTVAGNLTINGTSTIVNSTTVTVDDSLLKLGDGNTANSIDVGVYGEYDTGTTAKYAGWFRDASDSNIFKLFVGLEVEPGTTVNTAGTGYTVGTLLANITGGTVSGLSAAIGVADGGTGASTFTTNGVLYGNGASALQVTSAGTVGQVLQANSSGVPVFAHIDGGTY